MPGGDGDGDDDFVPMAECGEWGDVAPRPPPALPQPVVAIGRDALQGDLMDYFWAAVAAGELRCVWRGWAGGAGGQVGSAVGCR